jgi:hypothetical protein
MSKYRKDVGEFIRYASGHGFTEVGMNGRGHWKLLHTSGFTLVVPATPNSGSRWRKNATAHIKRIEENKNDDYRNCHRSR